MRSFDEHHVEPLVYDLFQWLEEIRTKAREDSIQRAEILAALQKYCHSDLLVVLWKIIREVDPRQEMALVRLISDLDVFCFLKTINEMIREQNHLNIAYSLLALHSSPQSIRRLIKALRSQPEAVVHAAAQEQLAPYTLQASILMALKTFGVNKHLQWALRSLHFLTYTPYSEPLLLQWVNNSAIQDQKPIFVVLGSAAMGLIHLSAYRRIACQEPHSLDRVQIQWLRRVLRHMPEIIGALAENGPPQLDGSTFVRARIQVLRELGTDFLLMLCRDLFEFQIPLISVNDKGEELRDSSRTLAYLMAFFIPFPPLMLELGEGLLPGEPIERTAFQRLLGVSQNDWAFDLPLALIMMWYKEALKPKSSPIFHWLNEILQKNVHTQLEQKILEETAKHPDFVLQIWLNVDRESSQCLRDMMQGKPISFKEMVNALEDPFFMPLLFELFKDFEISWHPHAIISLVRGFVLRAFVREFDQEARQSFWTLGKVLQALRTHWVEESPLRTALDHGILIMQWLPQTFAQLPIKALKAASCYPLDVILHLLNTNRPHLELFFWYREREDHWPELHQKWVLKWILYPRNKRFVDQWVNGKDEPIEVPQCLPTPSSLLKGFSLFRWGMKIRDLSEILEQHPEMSIISVPRRDQRTSKRVLILHKHRQIRLEFDHKQRLFRLIQSASGQMTQALELLISQYGLPTAEHQTWALWAFEKVEFILLDDPLLGSCFEIITAKPHLIDSLVH